MDAAVASIIVAFIGTIGGIIVAFIQKFKNENKKDHDAVMAVLEDLKDAVNDLDSDVSAVDNKIDQHIIWHLNDKK